MLFSRKDLVRANFTLVHFCFEVLLVKRCSISSLTKFSTQEENDTFWLKQLSRKDWLAPKEVLKVFKNLRDIELVMDALSKASARLDYKPSETLYSLLIDRFSHVQKFDVISDLLDRANSEKCQLSNKFFYRVIKIYGNLANCPELAIGTLYRMPEFQCWPSVKTFNYVLNLLVCTKRFEKVHEIFLSASRLGVLPDTCCFNILIKGLCRLNKLEASFSVLHEISEQGLHPSATTYSMLMHSLCKHGRLKEAFEVYETMEREGCHPDSVTFNILISGLCEDGKVDDGMGLLKTMQLKGCCPDAGTYQALLYGMLKDKRFVDAKNFMCKMISERRYPSFLSYKMTIEGLCSERFMHDVDSVLRQMVSRGFVPKMGTWRKIIWCMFSKKKISS